MDYYEDKLSVGLVNIQNSYKVVKNINKERACFSHGKISKRRGCSFNNTMENYNKS